MEEIADEIIITTLKFWIKKVRRGDCTREQKLAVVNAFETIDNADATIDDLAAFYGESKDAVKSLIKRNYIGKPKRNVVLYSFAKFRKIVPNKWRVGGRKSDT